MVITDAEANRFDASCLSHSFECFLLFVVAVVLL